MIFLMLRDIKEWVSTRLRLGVRSKSSSVARSGFTLVELLVVISIIGILAGLLLVNLSGVRERGRDTVRKSDLNQLKTALRLYYNDYQTYPASNGSDQIMGCGSEGITACTWGGDFGPDGTKYMQLPLDPLGGDYDYEQTNGGEGFILSAQLENLSDSQAESSQIGCGVASGSTTPGVFMVCTE